MKIMFVLLPLIAFAAFIDVTAPSVMDANIAHHFPYPLDGIVPVLVLLSVGLLSARYPGNRKWVLPAAFVLMFAVGLGAGVRSVSPLSQAINFGGVASLVISAALALSGRRPSLWLVLPLFALLAWGHGFAHGAQVSSFDNAIRQSREMVCAASVLLLSGLAAGVIFHFFARRWRTPLSEREAIPPHETP